MSITLTFRTAGAWGAGKGSNLSATEVDTNFWNLAQAIEDIQDNPPTPITISSVTVAGTNMTFVMSDASTIGPIPLPVLKFRYLGAWQANFAYAVLDTFFVNGIGIFTVQIAHTSGSSFDPDIEVSSSPALLQLFGATGFTADQTLAELTDVDITSALADGDFFVYDGGSVGAWVPMSAEDAAASIAQNISLADLSDVAINIETISFGEVLTWNGSQWVPEAPSGGGGGSSTLGGLTDVDIDSTLADADVLTWHAATSRWIAAPASGGGSGSGPETLEQLSDVAISGVTTGQVLAWNGSDWTNQTVSGGGGANRLVQLTDVDIDSTLADGDFLKWHEATNRWIAAAGGGGAEFLADLGDVEVGSPIADGDVLTWNESENRWLPQTAPGSVHDADEWSGFSAYTTGSVVSHNGREFLNYKSVSEPPGSLTIESVALGSGFNSVSSADIVVNTTENNAIILLFVLANRGSDSGGSSVSTVTSTSGLTWNKRVGHNQTGSFYSGNLEIWWALAETPVTSETINVTMNASGTYLNLGVAAVYGSDLETPFDSNGSLPAIGFSSSSGFGSATFSTDAANSIAFALELCVGGSSYSGAPSGFTEFTGGPNANSGGTDSLSYKSEGTPQTGVTVTSSTSTANSLVLIDAIAFGGNGNTAPEHDTDHWFPAGGLLSNLLDVDLGSGAADGDILQFDAATGKWLPVVLPGGGGGATPTQSNTGLTTWLHQNGASVVDTDAGILITGAAGSGANISGIIKAAPSAPYTITAKIAGPAGNATSFPHVAIGWYDGSNKLHLIDLVWDTSDTRYQLEVTEWNSPTSFSASSSGSYHPMCPGEAWVQIEDDGTDVYFRYSLDGENFQLIFSVAKSSGWLGGSGYTHIVFEVNNQESSGTMLGTLLKYSET